MPALRSLIAVTVAVWTIGCYSWKPVRLDANPEASTRPSRIEITTKEPARYTVYHPEVRGDSLHGWLDDSRSRPVSFVVSQIAGAEVRKLNVLQVMGVTIGLAAVVVLTLLFLVVSTGPDF